MKKILLSCMMALVAMCGLNSCSEDCDHDFIEFDHSSDLVGIWTCFEEGFAEALVIKADGSVLSTGYDGEDFWEDVAGNIVVKNSTITMTFEDGDNWKGHFDIVPGVAFSIFTDKGDCLTFNYCKEDLSDEVVGMWVCNDGPYDEENEIMIRTYGKDGIVSATGIIAVDGTTGWFLNEECKYRVVGDLKFKELPKEQAERFNRTHMVEQLIYTPNATALGDIMNTRLYLLDDNSVEFTTTFLRIKQNLELPGMKYNYSKNFISNVKGLDKDIEFMGYTMNFAKMDGSFLDKMLKMFNISFPDANTMHCVGRYSGGDIIFDAPIVVDGNKITVKMSEKNAVCKDVELYAFQDKDNTQFHIYMSTTAFVNFFGNMQVTIMEQLGQLDTADAAAVQAVFDSIDDAVETINLSLVMTKAK